MAVNPTPLTPKTKGRSGSLIVMTGVAVLLGLVAAAGIWQYLMQTQQQVKKLTATRPIVVASKEIPAGTKLTEEFLSIKDVPAQTVPKDYPSSVESLKGRIVRNKVQLDELINEARLVGQGAAGGLPVVIPPGFRAIAIKVNEVSGIAGFVKPGDHIDLVSVLSKDEENTFSKIILQNVLVLASGDEILDVNALSDPKAKVVSEVTLALSVEDAEKLALASQIGQIQLVLRPHGEDKYFSTEGARMEDVYGDLVFVANMGDNQFLSSSLAGDEKGGSKEKKSIEVILGDKRSYFYY